MSNLAESVTFGQYDSILLSFKDLADDLSTSELNAIYYLLRKNTVLIDSIDLRNNSITGLYGKYDIDLDKCTVIDEGVLITEETKDNLGSITLSDSIFQFSTYELILTVKHYSDWNIESETSIDNIETSTLIVELRDGEETIIPFNRLNLNYIVEFDAKIRITHNLRENLSNLTLDLSPKNPIVQFGDEIELNASMVFENGELYPVGNRVISLYEILDFNEIDLTVEWDFVKKGESKQLVLQLIDKNGNPANIGDLDIEIYCIDG